MNKKIVTYNVNGIRAALSKDWLAWLNLEQPDVICLQETKAHPDQLDLQIFEAAGYHHYWHSAEKKGYSGVAILSKEEPKNVSAGFGNEIYDREGRILRADFDQFSVASLYLPSGSSGDDRQAFKMQMLEFFADYANKLKSEIPNLVISGDYNICNKPIDIHNPKANEKTSGFLPEERAWFDSFLEKGFVDSFREVNKEPHQYTWWSYRAGARVKNLGWRIDYNIVSENLKSNIHHAKIIPDALHSDHCPCMLELKF
jgi:exodeoxyribonuclease III